MSLKGIQTSLTPSLAVLQTKSEQNENVGYLPEHGKTRLDYSKIILSPFSISLNRTSSNSSAPQPAPP
jgi:hypothetical protein